MAPAPNETCKQGTYQVDQVTEVFLYLLWRQAPHQVQGTVQLLVTLPRDRQECLSHSAGRNTKPPFKGTPTAAARPAILRADRPAAGPLPRLLGGGRPGPPAWQRPSQVEDSRGSYVCGRGLRSSESCPVQHTCQSITHFPLYLDRPADARLPTGSAVRGLEEQATLFSAVTWP